LYRIQVRTMRNAFRGFRDRVDDWVEYTLDQGIREAVRIIVAFSKGWIRLWSWNGRRIAEVLLQAFVEVEVNIHPGDVRAPGARGRVVCQRCLR